MKKLILSIPILFLFVFVNAQIFFGPPNDITKAAVAEPEALFASDLDGDQDLDLLVCSAGNRSLLWYEKLDDSKDFGPPQFLVQDVPQPANVISFDVDGDGDQDVIYGSWQNSELAWLENLDGLGNFSDKMIIDDYCNGVWRIHFADVDGDMDQDLLVALREGRALHCYVNNQGVFEKRILYEYGDDANLREAYPADLDGDGDIDVVTVDWYNDFIAWHENLDGNGTFSDTQIIFDQADNVDKVFCRDFDGDGDQDILSYYGQDLLWWKNQNGSGSFNSFSYVAEGRVFNDFFPCDFDGDGDQDILVSTGNYGEVAWYENNGSGNFGEQILISEFYLGTDMLIGADVDNDGDNDILGSGWARSQLLWYDNLDGAGDTGLPTLIDRPELTSPIDMELEDLDEDGDKDIVVASLFDGSIYLVEKEQAGTYGNISTIDFGISTLVDVHIADINNDTHPDILWCNDSGEISWHSNNMSLDFGPRMQVAQWVWGTSAIATMDINNDGILDVIAANKWQNQIVTYLNTGASFGTPVLITDQISTPSSLYVRDLNGDNLEELLVASKIGDRVYYLPNNGDGTFGDKVTVENDINGPATVICDDMDGDGDPDILTCAYDIACYYENLDGLGNFGPRIYITDEWEYPGYVKDIKTGDPDNDGDRDVFLALEDKDRVVWYNYDEASNEYSRDFNLDIYDNYNEPRTLLVDDVNGDGKDDVIVGSFKDNRLTWHQSIDQPVFLDQPDSITICQEGLVQFNVNVDKADSFTWQKTEPYSNYFENFQDDNIFSGSQTPTLTVEIPDNAFNQVKFRCVTTYLGYEFISDEALLTVDALIESDAGEDQEICTDFTYLYGSWYGSGSGLWTIVEGYAVFDNPSLDYCQISEIAEGDNVFKWTVSNGSCVSEDELRITRYTDVQVSVPQTLFNVTEENQDLTMSVNSSGSIINHQWYKDNTALMDDDRISGSQSAYLTLSKVVKEDEGNYHCVVEGECNTVQSENIFVDVELTNLEETSEYHFRLFPNPSDDFVNIVSQFTIDMISIYNSQGQLLKELEIGKMSIQLSVDDLIPGNYLLKIQSENRTEMHSFIRN